MIAKCSAIDAVIPVKLIGAVCHSVASALCFLKKHDVIHRDIKPGIVSSSDRDVDPISQRSLDIAITTQDRIPLNFSPSVPDSKPSTGNILVDKHGIIKISDFGGSGYLSGSFALSNPIMTHCYAAPERINHEVGLFFFLFFLFFLFFSFLFFFFPFFLSLFLISLRGRSFLLSLHLVASDLVQHFFK